MSLFVYRVNATCKCHVFLITSRTDARRPLPQEAPRAVASSVNLISSLRVFTFNITLSFLTDVHVYTADAPSCQKIMSIIPLSFRSTLPCK